MAQTYIQQYHRKHVTGVTKSCHSFIRSHLVAPVLVLGTVRPKVPQNGAGNVPLHLHLEERVVEALLQHVHLVLLAHGVVDHLLHDPDVQVRKELREPEVVLDEFVRLLGDDNLRSQQYTHKQQRSIPHTMHICM